MVTKLQILVNGADNAESRGLLVLSALSFAAAELIDVSVRIIDGDDATIRAAAECLSWDTGLEISVAPSGAKLAIELARASLYVAVVVHSTERLPLEAAHDANVPSLIAIQFPGPDTDAQTLSLVRAAHDPQVLARAIVARLDLRR